MPRGTRTAPSARLVLGLALLCCFLAPTPAGAITHCHDYTYYRVTGVDDNNVRVEGTEGLEARLKRLGYERAFTVGSREEADDPKTSERLKPRDAIVIGPMPDHSGYVSDYGRIDHFIQVEGESGRSRSTNELPLHTDGKAGGLFLGDTLAQMYGRFTTKVFAPAVVWRKTKPTDAPEDDWAKAEAAARAILEEGKKLRADVDAELSDVRTQRSILQRETDIAVFTARSLLPALHSTQALPDLLKRLQSTIADVRRRAAQFDAVEPALTAAMDAAAAAAGRIEELAVRADESTSRDEIAKLRAEAFRLFRDAESTLHNAVGQHKQTDNSIAKLDELRVAATAASQGAAALEGLDPIARSLGAVSDAVNAAGSARGRAEGLATRLRSVPRRVKEALAKFPSDERALGLIALAERLLMGLEVPAEVNTPLGATEAANFLKDADAALDRLGTDAAEVRARADLARDEIVLKSQIAEYILDEAFHQLELARQALTRFRSVPAPQGGPSPPAQAPGPSTSNGIVVPDVVGMIPVDAFVTLSAAGLVCSYVRSSKQPPTLEAQSTCERQDPAAGSRAAEGDVVRVSIYSKFGVGADDLVTVPAVTELEVDNACAMLRGSDLDPVLEPVLFTNTFVFGVFSQDPEGGVQVRRGSIVILRYYVDESGNPVSGPPDTEAPPDPARPPGPIMPPPPEEPPDPTNPPDPTSPPPQATSGYEGTWDGKMVCTLSENSSTRVGERGTCHSVFTRRADGTLWVAADTGRGEGTPVQVVENGFNVSFRHQEGGQTILMTWTLVPAVLDTMNGTVQWERAAAGPDERGSRLEFTLQLTRKR